MKTELLSNTALAEIHHNLFSSENKPTSLLPIDILVADYLICRRAVDHQISDSCLTIARRLNVSRPQTIAASFCRLEKTGWIITQGRGQCKSKLIQVNYKNLPACAPVREKIGKDAGELTVWYKGELERLKGPLMSTVRKFRKDWTARNEPSAQRILDRYHGNVPLVKELIHWGMYQPNSRQKSMRSGSLYHIDMSIATVEKAYLEDHELSKKLRQERNDNEHANANECKSAA